MVKKWNPVDRLLLNIYISEWKRQWSNALFKGKPRLGAWAARRITYLIAERQRFWREGLLCQYPYIWKDKRIGVIHLSRTQVYKEYMNV